MSSSPSPRVLLYNSGSVSKIFFANKTDAVAMSYDKKNFKELLKAASLKKPNRIVDILIKD